MNTTIPIYIIYKITCIPTGKSYIGQTNRKIKTRYNEHFRDANRNKYNIKFHKSIRKHGKDNFIHEILFETTDQNIINEKEIEFIAKYDTYKNGYNSTIGGKVISGEDHWSYGKKHSKDFCKNISIRMKGKNHPFYGKHHTYESLEKIKKAQTGKKSHNYGGDFHTPHGTFTTSKEAATDLICATSIRNWCKNPDKIISIVSIKKSKYLKQLPESPLGKTFRELGFWFEYV